MTHKKDRLQILRMQDVAEKARHTIDRLHVAGRESFVEKHLRIDHVRRPHTTECEAESERDKEALGT